MIILFFMEAESYSSIVLGVMVISKTSLFQKLYGGKVSYL